MGSENQERAAHAPTLAPPPMLTYRLLTEVRGLRWNPLLIHRRGLCAAGGQGKASLSATVASPISCSCSRSGCSLRYLTTTRINWPVVLLSGVQKNLDASFVSCCHASFMVTSPLTSPRQYPAPQYSSGFPCMNACGELSKRIPSVHACSRRFPLPSGAAAAETRRPKSSIGPTTSILSAFIYPPPFFFSHSSSMPTRLRNNFPEDVRGA